MKIQEYKSCLIVWAIWLSACVYADDLLNATKDNSIHIDHGLSFNGDGYVLIQDHESLTLDEDFTIEFWIKPNSSKRYIHILNKHQPGRNDDGSWVLKSNIDPSEKLTFAFSWPYIPNEIHADVEKTFHKNEWVHFAFCYLKSENYFSFWINGNLIKEGYAEINIKDTDWPLYIGSEISYNFFKGLISEIRFSSIVRYKDEFRSPVSYHIDDFTLAYWPCDEGRGDILHDFGPNTNHGKLNNVIWLNPKISQNITSYLFLFLFLITIGTFIVLNKRNKDKRSIQSSLSSEDAVNANHKYAVEIRLFDHFQLRIDGKEINHSDWGSKKARELFIYILLHNQKGVNTEQISGIFWPVVGHKSAINSRNVALHKIRKVLGDHAHILKRHDDILKIVPDENIFCDHSQFMAHNGNGDIDKKSGEEALKLYGDSGLLREMEKPWLDQFKEQSLAKAHNLALKLGELYIEQKEWEKCELLGNQMLAWDSLDETAIKYIVRSLKESGNASRAKARFDQFSSTYSSELDEQFNIQYDSI